MMIAVDFDGTCVTHKYPEIGEDIGAVPVLKELVAAGHKLILLTMRGGEELADAVMWFHNNEIELWDANDNKEQGLWTDSRKVYAQLYIDDSGLGTPLCGGSPLTRPYVNWPKAKRLMVAQGIL